MKHTSNTRSSAAQASGRKVHYKFKNEFACTIIYIYMKSLIIDYACCFSQTMKNKHEAGKDCCLSYLFDLIDIRMIHGLEMVI